MAFLCVSPFFKSSSLLSLINTTVIGFKARPKYRISSSRDPLLKSAKNIISKRGHAHRSQGLRLECVIFVMTQFNTLRLNFCLSQITTVLTDTNSNLIEINNSLILGHNSWILLLWDNWALQFKLLKHFQGHLI